MGPKRRLVVLLASEPFLSQESQKVDFPFRLRLPMVGGAAASDLLAQKAGCDFYGKTAVDGLKYARQVAGVE